MLVTSEADKVIMPVCVTDVIIPTLVADRKRLVAWRAKSADAPAVKQRTILMFDGELHFLNAALDAVVDDVPALLRDANIELLKLPASCR